MRARATGAAELDVLMGTFLRAVSFARGQRPRYGDLRDLFVGGAC